VRITYLGTGTSMGIPVIGCECEVCSSPNEKNKRLRSSVYVEDSGTAFLIDASPDLRIQALQYNIKRIEAILFTHYHRDHIFGLDDIRGFNIFQRMTIPGFCNKETYNVLRNQFWYLFDDSSIYKSFLPQVELHIVDSEFRLGSLTIAPIEVLHANVTILGFRIGDFAYITDANFVPEESIQKLKGVKVLTLNALRKKPHISHFSIDQAIQTAQSIGAERTFFTHISHDLEHNKTNSVLPAGMQLAYDGLILEI